MKKSLLVLAIASTLAACGGGGGEDNSITNKAAISSNSPTFLPTAPVLIAKHNDVYLSVDGGLFNLPFRPDSLPTWIKQVDAGQYSATMTDCDNRSIELSNPTNKINVIQTSRIQCTQPDLRPAEFDFNNNPTLWAKEETGTWSRTPDVTWPRKRGTGQIKFTVKTGDCLGTDCTRTDGARDRSEIRVYPYGYDKNGYWYPDSSKEYWISYSFYVPKPYIEQGNQEGTSKMTTLMQIMTYQKTTCDVRPLDVTKLCDNFIPMLMISKLSSGNVYARIFPTMGNGGENIIIDDNEFEGKWHDILIKFKPNKENGKDNLLVYVNGVLKVESDGPTIFAFDKTYHPNATEASFYYKFGIYRPQAPNSPIQDIYFDEIRFGNSREEVTPR